MTVSSQTSRVDYAGDGVTAIFPVPFYFLENTHLQVILSDDVTGAETVLVLNTDYTVTGAGVLAGGSITVPSEPAVGFTLTILRSVPVTQETDYVPNDPFPAESHERALDKLTMIAQQQSTDSAGAIKVAVSDPEPSRLPPAASRALRLMGFDSLGNPIAVTATADSAAALALDLLNDTDPAKGAGQVGYSPGITVREKLESFALDAVVDFGCDPTGLTNSTVAMKAFFDYCIANGAAGHIPAGTYLITEGQLVFDNGFVAAAWPYITTDGYDNVTFVAAGLVDAPFITILNGVADSNVGKYWNGGSLGGITFEDNTGLTNTNRHGLSLAGIWGTKFGWMRGQDLGGDLIHIPEKLFSVTNPDPYAVTFCNFDGIEANSCQFALHNLNFLGFNGCYIEALRVIACRGGGFHGFGTNNAVNIVSMGSIAGWAFDDGTNVSATGGAPLRLIVNQAELDDVQFGIRVNRMRLFEFKQIRFVHRYNFSALNPSGGYWPRIAVDLAGGASAATSEGYLNLFHRIEAGGTKPDMGVFIQGNSSPNAQNITIDQRIFDNAALGFVDSDLFTSISANANSLVFRNAGRIIFDNTVFAAALVRSSTADTIPNTGFPGAAAKITFSTKLSDKGGYYDTANSWLTVPYTGLYRLTGKTCLAVAVGTRVRIGFAKDVASVVSTVIAKQKYQNNAAATHYEITGLVQLNAGDRVFFVADQNTAGAVAQSAPFSATADLTWSIEPL